MPAPAVRRHDGVHPAGGLSSAGVLRVCAAADPRAWHHFGRSQSRLHSMLSPGWIEILKNHLENVVINETVIRNIPHTLSRSGDEYDVGNNGVGSSGIENVTYWSPVTLLFATGWRAFVELVCIDDTDGVECGDDLSGCSKYERENY